MSDCVFCKIIAGEIPSALLFENEDCQVILDRFPSGEGHALVLPKTHVATIFDIDPALAGRLFAVAVKVAAAIREATGVEDMNILQNNGPLAGQTVPHFHIHLIPRRANDQVLGMWQPTSPTDEEIEAIRAKIAAKL